MYVTITYEEKNASNTELYSTKFCSWINWITFFLLIYLPNCKYVLLVLSNNSVLFKHSMKFFAWLSWILTWDFYASATKHLGIGLSVGRSVGLLVTYFKKVWKHWPKHIPARRSVFLFNVHPGTKKLFKNRIVHH